MLPAFGFVIFIADYFGTAVALVSLTVVLWSYWIVKIEKGCSVKYPPTLSNEAEQESYKYFDKYVRALPKKDDGTLDLARAPLQHNDVDAFRHAYVSGVFTHEYGEAAAKLAGWLNEAQ